MLDVFDIWLDEMRIDAVVAKLAKRCQSGINCGVGDSIDTRISFYSEMYIQQLFRSDKSPPQRSSAKVEICTENFRRPQFQHRVRPSKARS